MTTTHLKPLLKWSGGKRRIMTHIIQSLPRNFTGGYLEPFLGGGSVLFEMLNSGFALSKIIVSDLQRELMFCYIVLRDPAMYQMFLAEIDNGIIENRYVRTREAFIENRLQFNELKKQETCDTLTQVKLAVLFVYLNKTCFNGIYRENKSGRFNVPFGSYPKNPDIFNTVLLHEIHEKFVSLVDFNCSSNGFLDTIKQAKSGDFVYLDPPYHNTFTSYTSIGFSEKDQIKLHDAVIELHKKGCKVLYSNSNTEFIHNLFSEDFFHKQVIQVKRLLGCKAESRGKVIEEILIRNYSI